MSSIHSMRVIVDERSQEARSYATITLLQHSVIPQVAQKASQLDYQGCQGAKSVEKDLHYPNECDE